MYGSYTVTIQHERRAYGDYKRKYRHVYIR